MKWDSVALHVSALSRKVFQRTYGARGRANSFRAAGGRYDHLNCSVFVDFCWYIFFVVVARCYPRKF